MGPPSSGEERRGPGHGCVGFLLTAAISSLVARFWFHYPALTVIGLAAAVLALMIFLALRDRSSGKS